MMRGKRIVVTRALHQAAELALPLKQRGAEVLLYPCIAIVPPEETLLLDNALRDLAAGAFDWLVLTSANAAPILSQRLSALGLVLPPGLALACVGAETARMTEQLLDLRARVTPEEYIAEGLVEALKPFLPARLLMLQAEKARPVLREGLASAGARVHAVTAYRTVLGEGGVHLSSLLKQGNVDAITFTSASTVQNCARRLAAEGADISLLAQSCLACIGPVTSQAVRDLGLPVRVTSVRHTIEGLVEELEIYFRLCASARLLSI